MTETIARNLHCSQAEGPMELAVQSSRFNVDLHDNSSALAFQNPCFRPPTSRPARYTQSHLFGNTIHQRLEDITKDYNHIFDIAEKQMDAIHEQQAMLAQAIQVVAT